VKTLRTALIGLGRIGWKFHLPNIVRHPGFELIAVVDPSEERLKEADTEYRVKGYQDYRQLLDSEKLDVVVIASPTPFHADQAIAAFDSGCDVFCEKPLTASLQDTDRIIASMRSNHRKLMVYQPHRGMAPIVALRDVLKEDLIGRIYLIKRTHTGYQLRNDWQAFRKYGGGMLNNYGAHFIDQLLSLSGRNVKKASCWLRSEASLGDAEDVVKALLECDDGLLLDLEINMATAVQMPPWFILGKTGAIVQDEQNKSWKIRYFRDSELGEIATQEGLAAEQRSYGCGVTIPWREVLRSYEHYAPVDHYQKLYEHIALNRDPFVPIEQTRELMRVIEECRRVAE